MIMKSINLEDTELPWGIVLGVEIVLLIIVLGISGSVRPLPAEPQLGLMSLVFSLIITVIILAIVLTLLALIARAFRSH
jgi:quinol-cytochrome oxidoreductase complex cytochrome b subunit